jgi:hypothetical protein
MPGQLENKNYMSISQNKHIFVCVNSLASIGLGLQTPFLRSLFLKILDFQTNDFTFRVQK